MCTHYCSCWLQIFALILPLWAPPHSSALGFVSVFPAKTMLHSLTKISIWFYSLLHCLKPPAMVMSRTDGTTWNHEGGWFGRNTGHIQHPKHSHSQGPSFFLIFSIQVLHCFTLCSLPNPTLVLLSNGTQKTIWSSFQIIFLPYLHVVLLLICH